MWLDADALAERTRTSSRACSSAISPTAPKRTGGASGSTPSNTSTSSPNSHGRPRQPRPTTTPSQPVARIIRSASNASNTSPLPSTGIVGHQPLLSSAIASQSALARVELRGRARVQRHRPRAGLDSATRPASRNVRSARRRCPCGTSPSPAPRPASIDHRRTNRAISRGRTGIALPPPCRRDLADRAAEVEVDVVHAPLADQDPRRVAKLSGCVP